MDYPAILRQIRKVNQWTQTDLAKALDITRSYASQLETGAREPSTKVIDKIKALESKPKLREAEADPLFEGTMPTIPVKYKVRNPKYESTFNILDFILNDMLIALDKRGVSTAAEEEDGGGPIIDAYVRIRNVISNILDEKDERIKELKAAIADKDALIAELRKKGA
jgi:transcriptional regulator with XRE-family HTH domain